MLDEDVKIGVIFTLAPLQVQNHCHLKSHILKTYAQVRTMLFDYCRAQAVTAAGDAVPMDLMMLGGGGIGKGKGDKIVKGKGKGKKDESNKDEDKKGEGKHLNNANAEFFAGYCLHQMLERRVAEGMRMLSVHSGICSQRKRFHD